MNNTERAMVDVLRRGHDEFGYFAVKAEFEAEGTRVDELLRLIDIAGHADMEIALKIGGCEAVRDLLEAKQFGAGMIIAPMIESTYALEKFIRAKNKVYSPDERADTGFLFNLETIAGFREREALIATAGLDDQIQGVVFGRVDFSGSLGRSRDAINDSDITDRIIEVAGLCKQHGRSLVVGGGVSSDSIPALRAIRSIHLTRFETRKVVFAAEALDTAGIADGLLNSVRFELLWLQNKRDYYGMIHEEDARRIEMLEKRWRMLQPQNLTRGT